MKMGYVPPRPGESNRMRDIGDVMVLVMWLVASPVILVGLAIWCYRIAFGAP